MNFPYSILRVCPEPPKSAGTYSKIFPFNAFLCSSFIWFLFSLRSFKLFSLVFFFIGEFGKIGAKRKRNNNI